MTHTKRDYRIKRAVVRALVREARANPCMRNLLVVAEFVASRHSLNMDGSRFAPVGGVRP